MEFSLFVVRQKNLIVHTIKSPFQVLLEMYTKFTEWKPLHRNPAGLFAVWMSHCKAWYNLSKQALCFLKLWPILLLYNVLSSLLILLEGKKTQLYHYLWDNNYHHHSPHNNHQNGRSRCATSSINTVNVRDDSWVWVITTTSNFCRVIIGWHRDYTLQLYSNSCQFAELAPKHNSWDEDFYSCHKHKCRRKHIVSIL